MRLLIVAVSAAVLLASCGDDGDVAAEPESTTTSVSEVGETGEPSSSDSETTDDTTSEEQPDVAPQSIGSEPLTLRSMGPLALGMTVDEAAAAGIDITVDSGASTDGCRYGTVADDPSSPFLMIVDDLDGLADDTIVRIELAEGSSTRSGIGIGSTKDEVLAAYGDQIEISPHHYTFEEGGEYLTFVPNDASDADYRLVMETLNDEVTQIRAGLLPAVEWVEGCF